MVDAEDGTKGLERRENEYDWDPKASKEVEDRPCKLTNE